MKKMIYFLYYDLNIASIYVVTHILMSVTDF